MEKETILKAANKMLNEIWKVEYKSYKKDSGQNTHDPKGSVLVRP